MAKYPDHSKEIKSLKRIEGQVRGIQKMVEEGQYCVDILNQVQAAIGALAKVEDGILERHLGNCVTKAVKSSDPVDRQTKIGELIHLMRRFRKI